MSANYKLEDIGRQIWEDWAKVPEITAGVLDSGEIMPYIRFFANRFEKICQEYEVTIFDLLKNQKSTREGVLLVDSRIRKVIGEKLISGAGIFRTIVPEVKPGMYNVSGGELLDKNVSLCTCKPEQDQ